MDLKANRKNREIRSAVKLNTLLRQAVLMIRRGMSLPTECVRYSAELPIRSVLVVDFPSTWLFRFDKRVRMYEELGTVWSSVGSPTLSEVW